MESTRLRSFTEQPATFTSMLRRVVGDDSSIDRILEDPEDVMDLVLDAGKSPVVHFRKDRPLSLGGPVLSEQHIRRLVSLLPRLAEDRCYLPERPTDRISIIRGYDGSPSGITWRFATKDAAPLSEPIKAYLSDVRGSVLVFGRPGCGKTTVLRSMIAYSSDVTARRVMVVDPFGELMGGAQVDSAARSMMLYPGSSTEALMEHAIRYHSPEVLAVDEIVTRNEARSAYHAGLRGIQLLASCHARSIGDLVSHPVMRDLLGSTQSAAVSDTMSKHQGSKFVTERRHAPLFEAAYDVERDVFVWDLASEIDAFLKQRV
jgi:stage III sporulation protein SpoIIIAA